MSPLLASKKFQRVIIRQEDRCTAVEYIDETPEVSLIEGYL